MDKLKFKNKEISITPTNSFFLGLLVGVFLMLCHKYSNLQILRIIANYTQFLDIWFLILVIISIQKTSSYLSSIYTYIFFTTFVLSFYIFQYLLTGEIDSQRIIIFWLIAAFLCAVYVYVLKLTINYRNIQALLLGIPLAMIVANIAYLISHSESLIYIICSMICGLILIKITIYNYQVNYYLWILCVLITSVSYIIYIGKPLTDFI